LDGFADLKIESDCCRATIHANLQQTIASYISESLSFLNITKGAYKRKLVAIGKPGSKVSSGVLGFRLLTEPWI
jgi:hypothetical protein